MGFRFVCIVISFLATSTSYGQNNQFLSNRRNDFPGGRPSQLGGAYTAISDDPAGCYYNPAGIHFSKKSQLSVSANTFHRKKVVYHEAVNGQDFIETSEGLYPNFVGFINKIGPLTICFALINTDNIEVNQNDRFEGISTTDGEANSFFRTHQESGKNIVAGAGLALGGKNFSLGAFPYVYYRTINSSNHQMTLFNGGSSLVLAQKFSTENSGVGALVGLQLRIGDFRIGLSYRDANPIDDVTIGFQDLVVYDPNTDNPNSISSLRYQFPSFAELTPPTYRLGLAIGNESNRLWSVDIIYHQETINQLEPTTKLIDTINASLGYERKFSKFIVRAGLFTNYAMFPAIDPNKPNQPTHIDYYGTSVGLALRSGKTENSFYVTYQVGDGQSQIVSSSSIIQSVSAEVMMMSWSSNYAE